MKGNIQVCSCRECNWRAQRKCNKKAVGFLTLRILLHYVILPTRSVSNVALTLECNWIYSGYTLYKVCITIPGHSYQNSDFYNFQRKKKTQFVIEGQVTKLFTLVFMTWDRCWIKVCLQSSLFIWCIFFMYETKWKYILSRKISFFIFETEWNFFCLKLNNILYSSAQLIYFYFSHMMQKLVFSLWKKNTYFHNKFKELRMIIWQHFLTSCQVIHAGK